MEKLFIIILLILLIILLNNIETFLPMFNFWIPTRNTKHMIYDIRGSPYIIPQQNFVWNNPE